MRVEAPRLSEQPVLPSFPTVTSLPSKDKEHPPHLSGDAEGKGPPMKKRKRFSLAWLALLALAGGVELLIVDGTLSGGTPLSRVASSVRETLDQTPTPANAASQQMYIWKDASGVTHISETPPPKPPAAKWRNTSSRRSLQPRSPSPSPLSIYRALSTSRPPPNWKRPPLKPGKGSNSRSNSCKRSGGSLKSNYTAPGPRATATRRSVSVLCWNRTERRWKSSSPNSDICHAATLPQRIYPD